MVHPPYPSEVGTHLLENT